MQLRAELLDLAQPPPPEVRLASAHAGFFGECSPVAVIDQALPKHLTLRGKEALLGHPSRGSTLQLSLEKAQGRISGGINNPIQGDLTIVAFGEALAQRKRMAFPVDIPDIFECAADIQPALSGASPETDAQPRFRLVRGERLCAGQ